ncbi:hypothetical protein BDV98DRAFT_582118 [Pterulicium gracile]|uniref:Extracellular membrane protein CFEM domain-containing protein n=1 Tax=Pterulicium gracile TaxID=1884261 RepID=A0A5C3QQD5_9AGAR|nr:hypothetical protein BDV98DRAFT_582118 [Pterula gracilis]
MFSVIKFTVPCLALASSQVYAARISARAAVDLTSLSAMKLIIRQDSNSTELPGNPLTVAGVPTGCVTICKPAEALNNETCLADPKCFCTVNAMQALSACMTCVVDLIPDTEAASKAALKDSSNEVVSALADSCTAEGFPLKAAVFTGSEQKDADGAALGFHSSSVAGVVLGTAAVVMISL